MFWFSLIYLLYPDEDFSGVNNIGELIRKEILKQKVLKDIKEQEGNIDSGVEFELDELEGFRVDNNKIEGSMYQPIQTEIKEDVKKIEELVEDEYRPENLQKSIFEQYFSRLYFSIITGCLLGYGDVYPITIRSKFAAMIQALITVIIIVM
jgi:hypothetical protein